MIILFGGLKKMIKELVINNLYGEYDYDIHFDKKLTFLYGNNGCGKTTILNIVASIITGKLYNLSNYSFDSILLVYKNSKSKTDEYLELKTETMYNNTKALLVSYNHFREQIDNFYNIKDLLRRNSDSQDFDEYFFSIYPFASDIRDMFEYVYLPLNRYGRNVFDDRDFISYSARMYRYTENPYNTYLNDSLRYVERIIRESCMHINIEENESNNRFRNEILGSSITLTNSMPLDQMFKEIRNNNWQDILYSKNTYISILKEIGIFDENFRNKIEDFYREFKKDYDDYTNSENEGWNLDFIWKYAEYLKIKSITKLAEENEKNKEQIRRPRELFIKVINNFLSSSGTNKRMIINNSGEVIFITDKNELNLTDLSSGEKQMIITFASLIFKLGNQDDAIFIVDEPEASLHLDWQSKYVKSILEINRNIQMIFATHSPEIIGKYSNKAIEMKKRNNGE